MVWNGNVFILCFASVRTNMTGSNVDGVVVRSANEPNKTHPCERSFGNAETHQG